MRHFKQNSFIKYVKDNAVIFDFLKCDYDVNKLSALDKLLDNKRILYLGEEDHWISEKNKYRLIMLKYLFYKGFNHIGEEFGWSDGQRINGYFKTNDEAYLERIAAFGYSDKTRKDRNDNLSGSLKDSSENYPVEAFTSDQINFYRELRKYAGSGITYFGFGPDVITGGGYGDIKGMLLKHKRPEIKELLSRLKRVENETLDDEIKRLESCLSFACSNKSCFAGLAGESAYKDLIENMLTIKESLMFNRMAGKSGGYEDLSRAMALREKMIFRHVEHIIENMKPQDKLVLMAHNRHLSKHSRRLDIKGGGPGGGVVPSLGTMLYQKYGGEVFSIWQLFNKGGSSHPYSNLSRNYQSSKGSLNQALSKIGQVFLLPFSDKKVQRFISKKTKITGIYNIDFKADITRQADAVFFINEVRGI